MGVARIVNLDDAIAFLSPVVEPRDTAWLDVGAGAGTFTVALAHLVGTGGRVFAIDADSRALDALRRRTQSLPDGTASVTAVRGDARDLASVAGLRARTFDGILLANVLHYFRDPEAVLRSAAGLLRSQGRVVVVEYDRAAPSAWVPHPIPEAQLGRVVRAAGLAAPEVVAERPSRYWGRIYCAVARHAPPDEA
jgi:ubiquinone/menaquinone biosynthesis C-methylase UbiE